MAMSRLRWLAALPLALVLRMGEARAGDPPAPAMSDPPAGMGEPAMADPAMGDAIPAAAPALKVLTDAEAAPLLDALKKAVKTRTSIEALPAIDAIAGATHPDLEAALGKLLGHLSVDVAVRAAAAMGERANAKTGAALWKGWSLPINEKRPEARAAILLAMGKAGARLDDKQYKEVEALWALGASPESREAIAKYFEAVKTDKRPCKLLSVALDEPKSPANENDPANPPAAWWEAQYKLWRGSRSAIGDALKAITGQIFATSADAKSWFKAHKEFGVSPW